MGAQAYRKSRPADAKALSSPREAPPAPARRRVARDAFVTDRVAIGPSQKPPPDIRDGVPVPVDEEGCEIEGLVSPFRAATRRPLRPGDRTGRLSSDGYLPAALSRWGRTPSKVHEIWAVFV